MTRPNTSAEVRAAFMKAIRSPLTSRGFLGRQSASLSAHIAGAMYKCALARYRSQETHRRSPTAKRPCAEKSPRRGWRPVATTQPRLRASHKHGGGLCRASQCLQRESAMAIYHASMKIVGRQVKKGGKAVPGRCNSSVAAAAYQGGLKLYDERNERTQDYQRKG